MAYQGGIIILFPLKNSLKYTARISSVNRGKIILFTPGRAPIEKTIIHRHLKSSDSWWRLNHLFPEEFPIKLD